MLLKIILVILISLNNTQKIGIGPELDNDFKHRAFSAIPCYFHIVYIPCFKN